jgi:hypothetical protein
MWGMMRFGVRAGKWELILVSGVLCLVCHLLLWSSMTLVCNPLYTNVQSAHRRGAAAHLV